LSNIDLLYLITPIATFAFSLGILFYWRHGRGLSKWALVYSLAAYAGAIALKYAVQIPTIDAFRSAFGGNPVAMGLYYGIQTSVLEVGGALLVAWMAVSRGRLGPKDAGGYGLGLAFWENGVLFAIPLLLDYTTYYFVLSMPNSSLAQTLLATLTKDSPGLFYAPSAALPLVFYAVLERVSSLMVHFAWGLLCVLAAVYRKRLYLAVAFPLGFVDFLVPFSGIMGIGVFEFVFFVISAAGLALALRLTASVRRDLSRKEQPVP
jgi:uncharacterized membrane protein YhfC